tara:strand:- start:56 stop:367 length:312 start_codon:yes stop_codon:yes gene_type:complete
VLEEEKIMTKLLEKWDVKMQFSDCSGGPVAGRISTLACPHCFKGFLMGHLSWFSMVCGDQFGGCGKEVKKEEFIRIKSKDRVRLLRWRGNTLVFCPVEEGGLQ